jgi:hypothetical protein
VFSGRSVPPKERVFADWKRPARIREYGASRRGTGSPSLIMERVSGGGSSKYDG